MNAFERGLLRYLSEAQLQRIQRVCVGIAGAGGLGSNCAAFLVRSGFKRLVAVDFDTVEPSNLNRQFFFASQIGRPKVEALEENLRRINPDLQFTGWQCTIKQDCARELFSACSVVAEALDAPEDKAMLVGACGAAGKFLVAASGIAGYGGGDRIRTRRIGGRFYVVGDLTTDVAQAAPFAPGVAIAAAKQADVILAHVLDEEMEWNAGGHGEFFKNGPLCADGRRSVARTDKPGGG